MDIPYEPVQKILVSGFGVEIIDDKNKTARCRRCATYFKRNASAFAIARRNAPDDPPSFAPTKKVPGMDLVS